MYRDEGFSAALARQWGAAPWYVSSLFIHMVIFALFLLFAPEPKPAPKEKVKVVGEIDKEIIDPIDEQKPEEKPEEEEKQEDVKVDVKTEVNVKTEVEIAPTLGAVEDEGATNTGDNTGFADAGDSSGEPAAMGFESIAKSGGAAAKGAKFASRVGEKKARTMRKTGASKETQTALDHGLQWLADNQEMDGRWNCSKFEGGGYDISVTALAQLAFLGAGNSSKYGTFRKNVRAAERYLLSKLDPKTGRIGSYRYEAAVTMMAMAESMAMSDDKKLMPIVQGQVDDAVKYQSKKSGGWGYTTDADDTKSHVDTSVAGWWMMGMKSAKVAGANIEERNWSAARDYFKSVTNKDKNGVVMSSYVGNKSPAPNMTAVGLTCLQFLGMRRDDSLVKGQADAFMKNYAGSMISTKNGTNYYGWYYQALGFFQMGTNSVYWKKFNVDMQKVILGLQEKGGKDRGSWPVVTPEQKKPGHFEHSVGRVGVTSVACLILEVYYRYEEAHRDGEK